MSICFPLCYPGVDLNEWNRCGDDGQSERTGNSKLIQLHLISRTSLLRAGYVRKPESMKHWHDFSQMY